jgi:hypothetical protein
MARSKATFWLAEANEAGEPDMLVEKSDTAEGAWKKAREIGKDGQSYLVLLQSTAPRKLSRQTVVKVGPK